MPPPNSPRDSWDGGESLGRFVSPSCPPRTAGLRSHARPNAQVQPRSARPWTWPWARLLPGLVWPYPLTYLRLPGLQVREGVASFHSHPVGVRLRHFLPMWGSFTTDQWVLDIVRQGYPLPFVTMPHLTLTHYKARSARPGSSDSFAAGVSSPPRHPCCQSCG